MTNEDTIQNTGKWKQLWLVFFTIFFFSMLNFILIVTLMSPLWYDINEFIVALFGVRTNWLAIVLTLTYMVLFYSIFLVVYYLRKQMKSGITKPHILNRILPFPFLLICYGMLYLLITESGEEVSIVRTRLEFYSPIIWLLLIILLSVFLIYLIPKSIRIWKVVKKTKRERSSVIIGFVFIILVYSSIFILPFILLPANVVTGQIPEKPKLVAHRGASHLAPENTFVAGELAVTWGAVGIEVDVTISIDGVLFIMHDTDLKRTTNVEEIFPERTNEPASNFTIAELRTLDAGSWFVDQDPFNTIRQGYVDSIFAESYRGEKVPTLAEMINLTRDNNLLLDIDYRRPSSGHPYYETYYDVLLTQLNASGLGKNILISSFEPLAENMTHVCGAFTVCNINGLGCELVNTHHGLTNKQFKEYESADIEVMVWTVDSPSRFSQLWCLGVDYIKTNSLHLMANMTQPIWTLEARNYYLMWAMLEIGCSGIAVIVYSIRKHITKK